jgi:hypothetical protein
VAHSFAGVAFQTEQQDMTSVPIWPRESVVAVEHIPGGDLDIVQHLGKRGAVEVAIPILVRTANWAAFVALQGQTAALVLTGNASRSATLIKLQNARWFEREGLYKVTATWLG